MMVRFVCSRIMISLQLEYMNKEQNHCCFSPVVTWCNVYLQYIWNTSLLLHCTVLYCTVLYCTVLYCTVLYCTVLYCTVLNNTCTGHNVTIKSIIIIMVKQYKQTATIMNGWSKQVLTKECIKENTTRERQMCINKQGESGYVSENS